MYVRHIVQYPLFLSDLNETLIVSTDFRKILKYKIRPVRAELFHAESQTNGHPVCWYSLFAMLRTLLKTSCVLQDAAGDRRLVFAQLNTNLH